MCVCVCVSVWVGGWVGASVEDGVVGCRPCSKCCHRHCRCCPAGSIWGVAAHDALEGIEMWHGGLGQGIL